MSLDYIGNYQNTTADDLVNKIDKIIVDTGINGFHFVDEAAPPSMLKALSKTLIERKVSITGGPIYALKRPSTVDFAN